VRVVLDTNVLVSALIAATGPSNLLYQVWRAGRFTLVTSEDQLDEFRRVTRSARLRPYLLPAAAGTMFNELRLLALVLTRLPTLAISRDPGDNFVIAMAQEGRADFLVTGDKRDLLALRRHGQTRILTVRQMVTRLGG
jgi:putative PIN family toxin of toxin-antitoxin system